VYFDDSFNNTLIGGTYNDYQAIPTQDYGIVENVESDWNIIIGASALKNQVYGIEILGANSQVNLCYNSTTWIP